jgi:hypothetical protein
MPLRPTAKKFLRFFRQESGAFPILPTAHPRAYFMPEAPVLIGFEENPSNQRPQVGGKKSVRFSQHVCFNV